METQGLSLPPTSWRRTTLTPTQVETSLSTVKSIPEHCLEALSKWEERLRDRRERNPLTSWDSLIRPECQEQKFQTQLRQSQRRSLQRRLPKPRPERLLSCHQSSLRKTSKARVLSVTMTTSPSSWQRRPLPKSPACDTPPAASSHLLRRPSQSNRTHLVKSRRRNQRPQHLKRQTKIQATNKRSHFATCTTPKALLSFYT